MREVKTAEDRKTEILEVAGELFVEKGFEETSISDILKKVGIARGTLYYHFKSKEEIMDAYIEKSTYNVLQDAKKIANNKNISIEERLIGTLIALRIDGNKGQRIMEHMHRPQNSLMHQKMNIIIIKEVPPIFTSIVKDGIEQGIFNTPYPLECVETLVVYIIYIVDNEMMDLTNAERKKRFSTLIFNVERMVQAKEGSFKFLELLNEGEINEGK